MKILRGKNLTVQQEYVRMVCLISFQQDTETRFTITNPTRSAQIEAFAIEARESASVFRVGLELRVSTVRFVSFDKKF